MLPPLFTITPEMLRLISELEEFKGQWRLIRSLSPAKPSTLKLRIRELVEKGYIISKGAGRGAYYVRA